MGSTRAVTDEELFTDGGDSAMTELVGRYERPLYGFLLRMVGDSRLAEDLFQETFLRLHRHRSSYNRGSPLKPYLYRIAVNVARDAISRKGSRPRQVSLNGDANGVPLRERLPGPSQDPSAAGEKAELRTRVRTAVEALPEIEREVVHLRVFEGLKFTQIAEATGVPLATAKSRMLYAIRRLRPVLEAYIQGGTAAAKEGR